MSVFLEEDQQVLHVFQKKYFRRDERNIHKRTTFALLLHFHFGECFWASGIPPSLYSLPTQPSSFYKKNKKQNRKRKTKGDFHGSSSFTIYDSFSAPFSLNAYNWLVWPYTKRRRRLYARWCCCCWCSCSMFNRLSLKYTPKKMRSRHGSGGARRRLSCTTVNTKSGFYLFLFVSNNIYSSLLLPYSIAIWAKKKGKNVKAIIIQFSAGHSAETIFSLVVEFNLSVLSRLDQHHSLLLRKKLLL